MSKADAHAVYRTREDKLKKATELRAAGMPLTEIGKEIGYSKAWTCKMLKQAGVPVGTVIDKNGTRRTWHGMKWTSEYYSWISMRTRCCDPNHPTFKWYGGRGITLDPRWLDFHLFFEDMGPKPGKGYTIERRDVNKGYCKANCLWLPKSLQNRNQTNTKLSMEKAREIRLMYAQGDTSYKKLGKQYGVTSNVIAKIVKGNIWKEIAA